MAESKKKTAKKKTTQRQPSKHKPGQTLDARDKAEVSRRAGINRIIRQEDLRERIAQGQHLRRLEEVSIELMGIVARTKQKKALTMDERKKYNLRLKALKQASDNHVKMLNKLIGDEKALEVRDPEGKNPFLSLANAMKMALDDDEDGEEDED